MKQMNPRMMKTMKKNPFRFIDQNEKTKEDAQVLAPVTETQKEAVPTLPEEDEIKEDDEDKIDEMDLEEQKKNTETKQEQNEIKNDEKSISHLLKKDLENDQNKNKMDDLTKKFERR